MRGDGGAAKRAPGGERARYLIVPVAFALAVCAPLACYDLDKLSSESRADAGSDGGAADSACGADGDTDACTPDAAPTLGAE